MGVRICGVTVCAGNSLTDWVMIGAKLIRATGFVCFRGIANGFREGCGVVGSGWRLFAVAGANIRMCIGDKMEEEILNLFFFLNCRYISLNNLYSGYLYEELC